MSTIAESREYKARLGLTKCTYIELVVYILLQLFNAILRRRLE